MNKKLNEKAIKKMKELVINDDPEYAHEVADNILCEVLKYHGYEDLVDIYNEVPKWYS